MQIRGKFAQGIKISWKCLESDSPEKDTIESSN